jgi:hypothetical protein
MEFTITAAGVLYERLSFVGFNSPTLDRSCTSNPKSEVANWTLPSIAALPVQVEILDFGFEVQDSSNFKISRSVVTALLSLPAAPLTAARSVSIRAF